MASRFGERTLSGEFPAMSVPSRVPILASAIEPRAKRSNYPEPFASQMEGRTKRALGDHFGLTTFGVNLTTLAPGAMSSILHRHSRQQEFVYIITGHPTLRTGIAEYDLAPGMCVGFIPEGDAHHLVNRTSENVTYLEIGDRDPSDSAEYPEDDLVARRENDRWVFTHKDGAPY